MSDIALSSAVRSNLMALQKTSGFIERTQTRLSTGLSVSNPVDDAVKYFQAKSLEDRVSDLMERKSAMNQGVNALNAALEATDAIENLIQQMKGVVDAARTINSKEREAYDKQMHELAAQVETLVNDASYQGLNLLNSTASKLSVRFSDKADSKLDVTGVNFRMSVLFRNTANVPLGITAASLIVLDAFVDDMAEYALSIVSRQVLFNIAADEFISGLDKTIETIRAEAATMAGNVAILEVRSNFTEEYAGVMNTGAAQLTLADLNEEGANLLALQTRQQMGIQSLSFAGQSEQAVLGLFR